MAELYTMSLQSRQRQSNGNNHLDEMSRIARQDDGMGLDEQDNLFISQEIERLWVDFSV